MSAAASTKRALSTAHSAVDDCRDRLAAIALRLDELARRRRPPDRLELEDLKAEVEVADELAAFAYGLLDDDLEELHQQAEARGAV